MKKRITFSWKKDEESHEMVGLPLKQDGKVVGKIIKADLGQLTAEISEEYHKEIPQPKFENISMGMRIENDPNKRSNS